MRPTSLGVIGLGAIGGSLAWHARRQGVRTVLGWSPLPAERARAASAGALDDAPATAEEVVRRADLVVLAAPPRANEQLLERLAPLTRPETLLTDVGSVKQPITVLAARLGLAARFAGSHPFAGTHEHGFAAARPDLLRGALVYVTPVDEEDTPAREIAHFWETVFDAHPVHIDAARHDRQLAWTSHLPQAVASALGATLARAVPAGATFGPGARDTTRLAASNDALWTEVLLANAEGVCDALDAFDRHVAVLRRLLAERNEAGVRAWLDAASRWRRTLDA